MDRRVSLTDQVYELQYLISLGACLKAGIIPWKTDENSEPSFVISRVTKLIANTKEREKIISDTNPLDFTDQLWDILKTNRSIKVLSQAFQLIYNELQGGEFRTNVNSKKTSSLAKMLRIKNHSEILFPRLEPMICLQLLVELGLDRFQVVFFIRTAFYRRLVVFSIFCKIYDV